MILYSQGDFSTSNGQSKYLLTTRTDLLSTSHRAFPSPRTPCVLVVLFPTPERFELVPFHNESLMTRVATDRELVPTLAIAKDTNQGTLFAQHLAITYVYSEILRFTSKGEHITMSQNRTTDFPGPSPTISGTGQPGSTGQTGISGNTGTGTATATGLAQTAQQYGEKISEAAGQAKEYLGEKITVVGDKFKELQNADLSEVAENAKEYARKNPGQAILISAAAGLLLGLILRGRRS